MTGVVAGIVGIAALPALVFYLRSQGERENAANVILGPNPFAIDPDVAERNHVQPKLYSPVDPSTFPTPVSDHDSSYSDTYTSNPSQPGRYSDAAEL